MLVIKTYVDLNLFSRTNLIKSQIVQIIRQNSKVILSREAFLASDRKESAKSFIHCKKQLLTKIFPCS